jgi:hypothetical protein
MGSGGEGMSTSTPNPLVPPNAPGPFIDPELPDDLFMMRWNGDDDNVDGPFDGSTFEVDPETNIAFSHNGDGHPVFIRCMDKFGNSLNCIDGDGTPYQVEILPLPDNVLPEPELPPPGATNPEEAI